MPPETENKTTSAVVRDVLTHDVFEVQYVEYGTEELDAGLQIGFIGAIVQLTAQLICDQGQQHIPAVYKHREHEAVSCPFTAQ